MRKIIYTKAGGGISVVTPVFNTFGEVKDFTEAQAEQRAWDKLPADAVNPRWVDPIEVPTDRTFRNAWEDTGKVSINMSKAREIHKERLRLIRAQLLSVLDVDYQRADEQGNVALKAHIAAKKQVLRDVTKHPSIASAQTPDELKVAIPDAFVIGNKLT